MKTMNITGILKDTLKEESCVVLTTFSDFKKAKDDHKRKPGKSSFSEVSLIPSSPLIVAGTIRLFGPPCIYVPETYLQSFTRFHQVNFSLAYFSLIEIFSQVAR